MILFLERLAENNPISLLFILYDGRLFTPPVSVDKGVLGSRGQTSPLLN